MSDIEYSVITSDVIKSFDCIIILKTLTHVLKKCCPNQLSKILFYSYVTQKGQHYGVLAFLSVVGLNACNRVKSKYRVRTGKCE